MKWNDLQIEQKRPLDHKIEVAKQAIRDGLRAATRPALAFSAGKDSTVLLHLLRACGATNLPIIYGNTGVEYPECVQFAKRLTADWSLDLYEAQSAKTLRPGFRYLSQRRIWQYLVESRQIDKVLKPDGKLKSTVALEEACPTQLAPDLQIWPAGTRMSYWWCVDQYGWPLLGKEWSRLMARRINIDSFLAFSHTVSNDTTLHAYYDILRTVKISQACCGILKKEPAERIQASLDVDLIFKGLMASESRTRATNFLSRGFLFEGKKREHLRGRPFFHCQPMATWTDDDVWEYIRRFHVPYAPLYDMGYTNSSGHFVHVKRNGCMGCATDILFPDNHMSILRRTHPRVWEMFMRKGMATEIQRLQQARRDGQLSLFDVFSAEELLERRPCIFDRIDTIVLDDEMSGTTVAYDPETEIDAPESLSMNVAAEDSSG